LTGLALTPKEAIPKVDGTAPIAKIGILDKLAHDQRDCVIIVTHDLSIAERCDKVWYMSDGVLTEHQPVST
jgi:ABC-type lipoprotein export system ATPase subunit